MNLERSYTLFCEGEVKQSSVFLFTLSGVLALLLVPELGAATFNVPDGNVTALVNAFATAARNNQDDTINLAANGS